MPRIFDNIESELLPALSQGLELADHADFCVGYFNLRGWKHLDRHVEKWAGGEEKCCRLLVGMQRLPADEFRAAMSLARQDNRIDNQTALRLKKRLAEEESGELLRAIDDIYRYPLRPTAVDALNRQLRGGINDQSLSELVIALRDEDRLCQIHEERRAQEPRRAGMVSIAFARQIRDLFEEALEIEVAPNSLKLDYQSYCLAFRDVARSTDEPTILPPNVFCPYTMSLEQVYQAAVVGGDFKLNFESMEVGVLNSFAAELDGLIALLYGLSEEEFAYVLSTFPLVPDSVRVAAQNAFRDAARGSIQ